MPRKKSTTAPAPKPEAIAPESTETTEYEPDTILVGRLCADPVLRTTKTSGKPVSTIRVADNSGDVATFHDVVCWGRTAEVVCQYLKKGRLVEVQGRAQERTWTDKDGNERTTPEVSAYRVQFLSNQGSSPDAESNGAELS
jgi:single-strand DNA-binding protein